MGLFDYDPLGYTQPYENVMAQPQESSGLLGSIKKWASDPRNQAGLMAFGRALAQAGAPSRVGPTWGGGLSDAFAALNEGRQQYDTQQFERKFKEMKMREMETEAAKQQAEAERIKQAQQRTMALQKLLGGNTALGLGAQQGDVGPTVTNAARIPQDPLAEIRGKAQMAIGGGYMDEGMKMLKAAKDMRDKMELTPSGEFVNPYEPTPGKNYGKVDYLDLGGVKVPVLPSGQIKGTALQKSQSPDSIASNWTTQRGQNMTDARAREANAIANQFRSTEGQKAIDREFGKDFAEFQAAGGFADVEKQLTALSKVSENLGKKGNNYTGPMRGLLPDKVRAFTNPQAVDAKNAVEEVAQRNLRLVLGAQFTQVEGERLIARAYNDQLPPEVNKRRVDALFKQIVTAAKTKQDAANYFKENGTLAGWQGEMPKLSDFYSAIDSVKVDEKAQTGRVVDFKDLAE